MKTKSFISTLVLAVALIFGTATMAQSQMKNETKVVGGAEMYSTKDIVSNAVNSKDHTTLVAAVKAADLVATLQDEGPFTVFDPTNSAFNKLPKGTVETLLKPENKAKLQSVLTYHVLAGKFSGKDIMKALEKGNGIASFKTINGAMIIAMMEGKSLVLKDTNGQISKVTIADVNQSNGVIHVVDTVVLPEM